MNHFAVHLKLAHCKLTIPQYKKTKILLFEWNAFMQRDLETELKKFPM